MGIYITKNNNHDKLCVFGIVSDFYFLINDFDAENKSVLTTSLLR